MKKTLLLIAIATGFLLQSCQRIKNLANINQDLSYSNQVPIVFPGLDPNTPLPPGGIWLSFPSLSFAPNAQQFLTQYNTSASKIVGISLKKLSMQMLPTTNNFDFIDTVRVFVYGKYAQIAPEVLVAYKNNISKGLNTVVLDTLPVPLKNYFLQDSMYVSINAHFIKLPPDSTTLNIFNTFNLQANPLD